jgi:hypothetical protein
MRIGSFLLMLALSAAALAVAGGPDWQVCFTPGQDCTGLIVSEIDQARAKVSVQAYSFTSTQMLVGEMPSACGCAKMALIYPSPRGRYAA